MSTYIPGVCWLTAVLGISLALGALSVVFIASEAGTSDHFECFDCGIDPVSACRVPFAAHFFLVGVVFVVFDAEILVSLPIIVCPLSQMYCVVWFLFTGMLFLGLLLEFFLQTIDWKE